jgi:hypothetical protein
MISGRHPPTDYFGKRIEEFRSPISGIVLMSYDTPVIIKDEEIFL